MAVTNPYQMTASEQQEIRNLASQFNMTPEAGLAEANQFLVSGQAANMTDLRRIATEKLSAKNAQPAPSLTAPSGYTPVSSAPFSSATPAATKTADVSGYTPEAYTSAGYTATQYKPGGFDAVKRDSQTYDAKQAALTTLNVTPDQLVEDRIQGLLKKGSPLLTLQETKARQGMAAKGLLSSSMAEGEALRAVTESARDIATTDAGTMFRAAEVNAQQANALAQFNVREINAAAAFTAESANAAKSDNQRVLNSAAEFLANATNTAAANNAAALNDAARSATEAANQASAASTLAKNNAAAFLAQAKNATNVQEVADANAAARDATSDSQRAAQLAIAATNDANRFAADAGNRRTENDRLIAADIDLQKLNERARVTEQATNIFQKTTESIAKIMADPELSPEAKQAAVDQQKQSLNETLTFLESASKVTGLKELVTFTTVTPPPAAAVTPPPAAKVTPPPPAQTNPGGLTEEDLGELRLAASRFGLTPDQAVSEAYRLISEGQVNSMDDIRTKYGV